MTPRTDPTAQPPADANGRPAEPVIDDDLDDGPREPGVEIFLDLDPASRELLADRNWVNDEYNAGRLAGFAGEYVAVYRKQILGHGSDPNRLREQVARAHGVPADYVDVTYVDPPFEC